MSIQVSGALVSAVLLAAPAAADKAGKAAIVADVSAAITASNPTPTGYKGADGKVKVEKGGVTTTGKIEGTDAGFFVAFPPVEVGRATSLAVAVKGVIFQKQGWDHIASIQIMDEDGARHILREVCKEGKHGSCSGQPVTKPSDLRKGTTLKMALPQGLETIARIEVVFIGQTAVDAGFSISGIKLVK